MLQGGADSPGVAESPLLSPGERFPKKSDWQREAVFFWQCELIIRFQF